MLCAGGTFLGALVDQQMVNRVLEVLRSAEEPLMIGQIAERMGVSRPTAAKYVDVCEAAKLVHSTWYATARQVSLKDRASRKKAAG